VKYHVRKDPGGAVVTKTESFGEVGDLYDWNMEIQGPAQAPGILQVGYGRGEYGVPRGTCRIFQTHVKFDWSFTGLP